MKLYLASLVGVVLLCGLVMADDCGCERGELCMADGSGFVVCVPEEVVKRGRHELWAKRGGRHSLWKRGRHEFNAGKRNGRLDESERVSTGCLKSPPPTQLLEPKRWRRVPEASTGARARGLGGGKRKVLTYKRSCSVARCSGRFDDSAFVPAHSFVASVRSRVGGGLDFRDTPYMPGYGR